MKNRRRDKAVHRQNLESQPVPSHGRPRTALLVAAAVAIVAAWAYATSFAGVFVFDDWPAIVENPTIRSLSLDVFAPPAHATVSGRPVANLTFAMNQALAPASAASPVRPGEIPSDLANVRGFHAANLIIHVAAALALYGALRRTLISAAMRDRFARVSVPIAATTALLWTVHPLNTSAVTYIVQRVESLMGLFYLLTMYCAIRSADDRHPRIWAAAAILACALGMATKEVMVTAPLMVMAWDLIFDRTPWKPWANRNKRALYAGLVGTWILLAYLLSERSQASLILSELAARGAAEGVTPWIYLWTQTAVVVHYIRLAVIPTPLVFDYYGWPPAASPLDVVPQAFLILVLLGLTGVGLVRRRPLAFAGLWFFVILAPTSSVLPIPTELAAEHRMYLPLVAVIATAVIACASAAVWLPTRIRVGTLCVCMVATLIALGTTTRARNKDYWSQERLWSDTVAKVPDNARARVNYAIALIRTGRHVEAEAEMRKAVGLPADPSMRAQIYVQLGSSLCLQGQLAEGIANIERGLALDPRNSDADAILGQAYADSGDTAKGLTHFKRALAQQPDNPLLLRRVALLAATATDASDEDRQLAVDAGERAVRLTDRKNVAALEALGAAYARQKRFAEAVLAARAALALAETQSNPAAVRLRAQIALYERLGSGVAK